MNAFDLIILGICVAAAVGGYRLGLVARATSWLGMIIGVGVAARFVPSVVRALEGADPARLVLAAAGMLVGGAFLGQALGLIIGAHLHYALPDGRLRRWDRVGGAVAGVVGVLLAVWLIAPPMARAPGWSARLARNSTIARAVVDVMPAPPNTLQSIESLLGADLPSVLDAFEPAPDLGPPPPSTGLSAELADQVAASTVKVEVLACGRIQDGSGSVIAGPAEDLIVTNAHVVAGAEEIAVERHPDGARLPATLVAFDPNQDLAVLSVPAIDRPPMSLADGGVGTVGAVFGHPGGGQLTLSPFEIGRVVEARGRDIYDANPTEREVFFLSAQLHPGDSGGALVTGDGVVVGVAFAIAPDDPNVAYALTANEVRRILAGPLAPTSAGPCLR